MSPEIWFAPMQPTIRTDGTQAGAADYFKLFAPDADWSFAASKIALFKVYPELLRSASDDELRAVIAGLAARHIKLGMEAPVLVDTGWCDSPDAKHVSWLPSLIGRLKRLGGDLDVLTMVGPLVDGHNPTKPNGCHRPIDEVAADAARTIAEIRKLYPDISVGEIEPIGQGAAFPDWRELDTWFEAWKLASGKPLAFLQVDTVWGTAWQNDMKDVAQKTRAAGIKFGVIYKGEPYDLSDAAFVNAGLEHGDDVETLLGGPPDQVILQSWENYPRHALPDSDLTTMTGFIRAYLRPHTKLVMQKPGIVALTSGDQPLGSAELILEKHDPAPGKTMQPQDIAGIVPHAAVSAIFALRIHAECTCSDRASGLSLAGFDFEQASANRTFHWNAAAWANWTPGLVRNVVPPHESILRVDVGQAQPVILNGPKFPVSPDEAFTARFQWQVEPESGGTGSVAIIFFDKNDLEFLRVPHLFQTSWAEVARLKTGPDGSVAVPLASNAKGIEKRLRFAGNKEYRATFLPLDR